MASIAGPARADRDYVRLLHQAASTSEANRCLGLHDQLLAEGGRYA